MNGTDIFKLCHYLFVNAVRFTVVESPGVYIAVRPDGQTERLEKVE